MIYPLLTKRLSIEPLDLHDLESFVGYRRDPAVAKFQSWDPSYSAEQAKALIQSQEGVLIPAVGNWLQLAIHDRLSGELLGDLAIHCLDENLSFEVGFTIASGHQKNGFAKEALSELLEKLVSVVGTKKVIANTDRRNIPSIKLLTSLGFQQEPERTVTEEFKGETVVVDYFEKLF